MDEQTVRSTDPIREQIIEALYQYSWARPIADVVLAIPEIAAALRVLKAVRDEPDWAGELGTFQHNALLYRLRRLIGDTDG